MADLTITWKLSGRVGGRLFNYTATSVVDDVDDIMLAQATAGAGGDIFTPQSFGGLAAVMIVGGNTVGFNVIELEQASTDILKVFTPAGFPLVAYNGGGFNGMMKYSTTATHVPDQDPIRYAVGNLGGLTNFSAMGALKAIS